MLGQKINSEILIYYFYSVNIIHIKVWMNVQWYLNISEQEFEQYKFEWTNFSFLDWFNDGM